ncbi:MAG: hypothetical protein ABSF90_13180 [Syntrophobacteraceae bacterium]|jgi:hypothetical protein
MENLTLPIVACLFLAACGPVNQAVRSTPVEINKIQKLAVVIPQEGEFTVIDERAKATATPAFLFGLTGAIVASAYNQHMDSEKAKAMSGQMTRLSCRSIFIESFQTALSEYNRFTDAVFLDHELKAEDVKSYDAVVSFEILSWGLRVVERSQGDLLKPFLEIHAQLVDAKGNKLWDETDVLVGHGQSSLANYQYDHELFNKDMEEAIQDAGRKMAVSLIYQ